MTEEKRTLSFVEWAKADFTLYDVVPEVKSQDDLTKVLMVAQVVRDAISTYRNWLKAFTCWELMTWDEKIALMDFWARQWIRDSYELRQQALHEWSIKFDQILGMIAKKLPLPDQWIECLHSIQFFCSGRGGSVDYLVRELEDYLERSLKDKFGNYRHFNEQEEAARTVCRENTARLRQEFGLKEPDRSRK